MTSKQDGGPAFPTHGGNDYDDPRNKILCGGMTLRDWFAGQALAGMAANGECAHYSYERTATEAYKQADALLAARGAARTAPTPGSGPPP